MTVVPGPFVIFTYSSISSSLFHTRLLPIIFLFPILLDCTIIVLPWQASYSLSFVHLVSKLHWKADLLLVILASKLRLHPSLSLYRWIVHHSLPLHFQQSSGLRISMFETGSETFSSLLQPVASNFEARFLRFPISSVLSREKWSPGLDKRPILELYLSSKTPVDLKSKYLCNFQAYF